MPGTPKIDDFVRHCSKVAFDSNVLIGLFEDCDYSLEASHFFDAVQLHHVELWTSAMTIPEVLTKPMQAGAQPLVRLYEAALFESTLSFAPIYPKTAYLAARLGVLYKLAIRDALQASLLEAGVRGFVTADKDFKSIQEMPIFIIPSILRQQHR